MTSRISIQESISKVLRTLDRVAPGSSRSLFWETALTFLIFPTSILINRNLGAEDRGIFSLILLIPSTIITLGTCQWERSVKGLITSNQISPREALRRTFFYVLRLSCIFVPIGIIASLIYPKLEFYNRTLSALYTLSFPIIFLSGTLSSIYVASGSIDNQYAVKLAYQVSYILLVLVLILSGQLNLTTLVLTYFIIWVFSLIIGLLRSSKLKGENLSKKPSLSTLYKGFLPYAFESLMVNTDIWAMSFFGTLSGLGNYVALTGLMQPIGLVSNALTSGSTARLDWQDSKVVQRYLTRTIILMIIMFLGLVLGNLSFGIQSVEILLGKSFASGYWMVPWIGAIVALKAIATQFHFSLQLSGNEDDYLLTQTLDSFIRFAIILLLGWKFSELGILIGCLLSSVIKCSISTHFLIRQ